ERYHLLMHRIACADMRHGLQQFVDATGGSIRAVLLGTRRGDPYSSLLQAWQPTDPDWPPLIRIHVVLDWSYAEIWQYLREHHVPYCSLYDRGFTSLGSVERTRPNPLLLRSAKDMRDNVYAPAWALDDETQERAGRI